MTRHGQPRAEGRHALTLPIPAWTRSGRYAWLVVGTVCIGAFMSALDASIVTIALPSIGAAYHVGLNLAAWVSISYLLTLTALVVTFGRVADLLSRRTVYTAGFGVFIVGSALTGAAPTFGILIASRVLQAIGAGMLQANSVAIVTANAPPGGRGRAIGIQAAAQAVGLSLGPTLGGFLVADLGFRAVFYVNVPVGILGTLAALALLPRDRVAPRAATASVAAGRAPRVAFDVPGAALLAVLLAGLLFVLTQGYKLGWLSAPVLGAFALAAVCAVALVAVERRAKAPLIHPELLRRPVFLIGNVTGLLTYATTFGVLFLMPFELTRAFGLGTALSGVLLTAVPLAMMAVSPIGGVLADRYGTDRLTVVGAAVIEIGMLGLALLGFTDSAFALVPALLVVGLGMGLFTPPNNSSVMGAAPDAHLGTAGGVLNMARSLGMSMGSALAATLYASFLVAYAGRETSLQMLPNLEACRDAFLGFAVLAAVTVMFTLLRVDATGGGIPGKPDAERALLASEM